MSSPSREHRHSSRLQSSVDGRSLARDTGPRLIDTRQQMPTIKTLMLDSRGHKHRHERFPPMTENFPTGTDVARKWSSASPPEGCFLAGRPPFRCPGACKKRSWRDLRCIRTALHREWGAWASRVYFGQHERWFPVPFCPAPGTGRDNWRNVNGRNDRRRSASLPMETTINYHCAPCCIGGIPGDTSRGGCSPEGIA